MKTPVQYQHEIDQVLKEGKPSLEVLTDLEHSLQLDLHALQMQFNGRAASTLNKVSKQSGRERSEGQKHLEEEKQNRMQPYQDLLKKVQDVISAK